MLLQTQIKNVIEWKSILQAINDVVDEAMFICNQDGITFRGIDPSHIALLEITFPKSSFESYMCHSTFFGIKVEDFKNIISSASNEDTIEFAIEDTNKMNILIHGNLNMKYSINLIEKSQVNIPIPKVESKSRITLSPMILSKIISNIERVSEHITINTISDRIQFFGKGDNGNVMVDLEQNNPEMSRLETTEDSSSIYSLEYMAKIIRNIGKTSKNVNIEYGSKTPIHMMFDMPSDTKVEYYLAPRIE